MGKLFCYLHLRAKRMVCYLPARGCSARPGRRIGRTSNEVRRRGRGRGRGRKPYYSISDTLSHTVSSDAILLALLRRPDRRVTRDARNEVGCGWLYRRHWALQLRLERLLQRRTALYAELLVNRVQLIIERRLCLRCALWPCRLLIHGHVDRRQLS